MNIKLNTNTANVSIFSLFLLLFIRFLNFFNLISLSLVMVNFINLTIVILMSILIKIFFNYILAFFEQKIDSKYKNIFYFLRLFSNVLTVMFLLSGIFLIFEGNWHIINDLRIFLSLVIIFAIVWSVFFTKEDFVNTGNQYLKRVGIDREDTHFGKLVYNFKALLLLFASNLIVEILAILPYISYNNKLKMYISYAFSIIKFSIFLFSILFVRELFNIFLSRLNYQIRESDNEAVKNYLFVVPLISNLGNIIIYFLFFVLLLNVFGYTPTSFMSSLPALIQSIGILGAGLAFIARDTIANFISGIFILTDTPFVIGDRIKINSIYGDVEEIGIRTTKIKTLENTIVTVPNSKFTEDAVTSYRKYNSRIKVYYTIKVPYESDVAEIKEMIYDSLNDCDEVLKVPNFRIYFVKYGNYALEYRLIFWIRDINKKLIALDTLNTILNEKFKDKNISVPYPTLHVST